MILQCPGTKHVANTVINTLSNLLKQRNQSAWDFLKTSIILADPPPSLPQKIHTTWLHATFHHILAYQCHWRNGEIIIIIIVSTLSPLSRGTDKDSKSNALSFSHFSSISRKTESSAAVHGGHTLDIGRRPRPYVYLTVLDIFFCRRFKPIPVNGLLHAGLKPSIYGCAARL